MAGGGIIGALRVILGADTAQFEKGMNDAQRAAAKAGAAIGVAMGAMATALGYAIKQTIDEVDKLGKVAQRIGIPVEELSRLKYAAEQSGVAFESLQTAVGRFSKAMTDAASNAQSTAGRAFAAIGVSVTDAAGHLRTTTAVIADVADKFARMKDGAGKTALAIMLFGRSGAELIPMLNKSASGIRAMIEEADQLGITISTKTANAAADFESTLGRLKAQMEGALIRTMEVALPYLKSLADNMQQATKEGGALGYALSGLDFILKAASSSLAFAKAGVLGVASAFSTFASALVEFNTGNFTKSIETLKSGFAAIRQIGADAATSIATTWNGSAASVDQLGASMQRNEAPIVKSARDIAEATKAANAELRAMHKYAVEAMNAVINAPTETFAAKMAAVEQAVRSGSISFVQFGDKVRKIQEQNADLWRDTASMAANALTTIFTKSKAANIAAAIMNTAVGISKAWTLPPPFNAIQAALVAATGAAQIASIKSTNMGGGGSVPSVGGGSAGGGDPGAAAPSQMLQVQGINPGDLFSGDGVRALAQKLLDFQKDGGQVVFA